MPPKIYIKAKYSSISTSSRPNRLPLVAIILIVFGSLIIGSVAGPIAAYLIFTSPRLSRPQPLISPLASGSETVLNQQAVAVEPQVKNYQEDFTRLENWFSANPLPSPSQSKITHYNLSIPKLGIQDAVVTIGGSDLAKSLIHYPSTANPGELGTPVIFGHSILRQFYNPKNYLSIFSTIMTLQADDQIIIKYDGITYTYKVIDKLEVKPTDVEVLSQRFDGRFLKLITCVPEGTYLRRGIIVAQLI
ncbi:MAG: hypothetical protein UX17_C0019G0003 [Parcubacteria group bacterium GW2011_GWC2_45_7]|nr:MAG: hypothetical protein UX17_C0019G0003 [Parcubacteria group bacterium GW2011_GWC2_45_7]